MIQTDATDLWLKNLTNKKFFLDQHGCAKNQVDGEILVTRLYSMGLEQVHDAAEADLIIINSCGFIESAKKESLDSVIAARQAYPDAKILLAGCLAERYAKVFNEQLQEADGFFGNGDLSKIDTVVSDLFSNKRPVEIPEQKGVCCGDRKEFLNFKNSAYVKITEGCNNLCSFCAIPIIRGSLRSRSAAEIRDEISKLVANGCREINLIGQDLAAYGCGKDDDVFGDGTNSYRQIYQDLKEPLFLQEKPETSPLKRLMEMISEIPGDFWVRLLYIHPDHFNLDVLEVMEKDARFLPYFDIPFQSGSEKIIHSMNRKGSDVAYKKLIDIIRGKFPDAAIRTTFLNGFPGETDRDAQQTQEFLESIQSDWSGCFEYSLEEDTAAYKMKGRVLKGTSKKRTQRLQQIQSQITIDRLKARTGKEYQVIVEEVIENSQGTEEGLAIGRAWFQAPDVDGSFVIRYDIDDPVAVKSVVPGNVVKVRAIASSEVDMDGEFCGS